MDIFFTWARAAVCAAGIAANTILFCSTFKLRRPLNVCSQLIAADALTVILYCLSGLISLATFLTIPGQLPLTQCVPFQILPLAGFTLNKIALFFISVDRFFSVLCPIRYKQRNRFTYRLLLILLASLYLAINLGLIIRVDFQQPADAKVWCAMTDLFQSLMGPISQSILALGCLSLLLYGAIWLRLRGTRRRRRLQQQQPIPINGGGQSQLQISQQQKAQYQQQQQKQRGPNYTERIFSSLMVIMGVILVGLVSTSAVKSLTASVQFSASTAFILSNGSSLVSVFASASHPLILYMFSQDYRAAMDRVFVSISHCFFSTTNSQVGDSTLGVRPAAAQSSSSGYYSVRPAERKLTNASGSDRRGTMLASVGNVTTTSERRRY